MSIRKLDITKLKRKFNHKRKIDKENYDQIAHESSKKKAKEIKMKAKSQGYNARVIWHPLKKDKHYDVYIKKK